jgi:sugar O-acyltransferase (sialic acid O-acetyltransferase NeuD family)
MTGQARVPVILVAGGGLARETLAAIRAEGALNPILVLDDDPARRGASVSGVVVAGGLEEITGHPEALVVICAGSGSVRLRLAIRLAALGVDPGRFAVVCHPAASVSGCSELGGGTIVLAGVVLTADVRVGQHAVLMPHCVLTHDDALDDGVTVCAGANLGGSVTVGRAAYLGMGCSIRQGVRIGAGATVGMGAAVLGDVPDGETWAGVPARELRSDARLAAAGSS